ncbi:MAG: hypothetical protein ACK4N5_20680 [Myxococcales bacterium]
MNYADYVQRMRTYRPLVAEMGEYGVVHDFGREYPLLWLRTEGTRRLVITAGFHGEEPAGPLTMLERMPEILAYAAERRVGLSIYPCLNPTGFEDGTRYNRKGEKPNNDFLRYEVAPGVFKGELAPGEKCDRWRLYDGGPEETRLLRAELERHPAPDAALDVHQDRYTPGAWTYAYTFGPKPAYGALMDACARHVKVAAKQKVDEVNVTDALGLVEYNDGSITDYYMRRGVRFTAALETTTDTPMPLCHEVNLIWVKGFIDLAAGG